MFVFCFLTPSSVFSVPLGGFSPVKGACAIINTTTWAAWCVLSLHPGRSGVSGGGQQTGRLLLYSFFFFKALSSFCFKSGINIFLVSCLLLMNVRRWNSRTDQNKKNEFFQQFRTNMRTVTLLHIKLIFYTHTKQMTRLQTCFFGHKSQDSVWIHCMWHVRNNAHTLIQIRLRACLVCQKEEDPPSDKLFFSQHIPAASPSSSSWTFFVLCASWSFIPAAPTPSSVSLKPPRSTNLKLHFYTGSTHLVLKKKKEQCAATPGGACALERAWTKTLNLPEGKKKTFVLNAQM